MADGRLQRTRERYRKAVQPVPQWVWRADYPCRCGAPLVVVHAERGYCHAHRHLVDDVPDLSEAGRAIYRDIDAENGEPA